MSGLKVLINGSVLSMLIIKPESAFRKIHSNGTETLFGIQGERVAAIRLKDVSKQFENKKAVISGFNLDIQEGEFFVPVGPSGCSQSTTIRIPSLTEQLLIINIINIS